MFNMHLFQLALLQQCVKIIFIMKQRYLCTISIEISVDEMNPLWQLSKGIKALHYYREIHRAIPSTLHLEKEKIFHFLNLPQLRVPRGPEQGTEATGCFRLKMLARPPVLEYGVAVFHIKSNARTSKQRCSFLPNPLGDVVMRIELDHPEVLLIEDLSCFAMELPVYQTQGEVAFALGDARFACRRHHHQMRLWASISIGTDRFVGHDAQFIDLVAKLSGEFEQWKSHV